MPESPEVFTISRALSQKLVGKYIFSPSVNDKSRYFKAGGFPGQSTLSVPYEVVSIQSRGKKIIFTLKVPKNDEKKNETKEYAYMISFLGMEGHWQYKEGKHSGIRFDIGVIQENKNMNSSSSSVTSVQISSSSSSTSVQMSNSSVSTISSGKSSSYKTEHYLYYDDSRHFGSLEVVKTPEEVKKLLKDVGPDLLQDYIPIEQYYEVLTRPRLSSKTVMAFLLEQKYFSGVGNYLRSEILYACKLSPKRTLGSLNPEDIGNLYRNTLTILGESLKCGGLTIATYWDPEGRVGTFKVKVYGKDKDPYGNTVEQLKDEHGRTVHWVPQIQV